MTWGPGIDLPLVSRFTDPVSGLMVTSNRGSLGGVCQLGDGATVGTFPVLLGSGRRGMNFNGLGASNQRLVCANQVLGAGDISVSFTTIQRTAGDSGWGRIVCNSQAAGFDADIFYDGNYHLYVSSNALVTIMDVPFNAYMRQLINVTVTRTAGAMGTLVYVNGNLIATGNSGVAQVGDQPLNIGGYPNPGIAARPMDGQLFSFWAYPYLLTPTQIRSLMERDRATLNLFG